MPFERICSHHIKLEYAINSQEQLQLCRNHFSFMSQEVLECFKCIVEVEYVITQISKDSFKNDLIIKSRKFWRVMYASNALSDLSMPSLKLQGYLLQCKNNHAFKLE